MSALACVLYAGLLLFGGFMGFRKGSVASLVGSSVIAVLYLIAGYLIQNRNPNGKAAAILASLVLLALGVIRFLTVTNKMMPILFITLGAAHAIYQYVK